MPSYGQPAPWFECRSPINARFHFDTCAGRRVVISFFGSAANELAVSTFRSLYRDRSRFDDENTALFGVSVDPMDESQNRIQEDLPGVHLFWDFDAKVSGLYGCVQGTELTNFKPHTFVLDERLRCVASVPYVTDIEQHRMAVMRALDSLPPLPPVSQSGVPAPVLVVPRIFEGELCQTLIHYYDQHGGKESGFMRDIDGKTVAVHDYGHKRRRDQEIQDEQLRKACMFRIHDRLVPEIAKAFQFHATRIERYIVACYDADSKGHFRAHRDNTTKGTAHRKFAVSLNLNTGDYEGGQLWFPEFGRQRYVAPAGGAVVFSCSLLHEATPVTSGARYAFLPFLYDEDGARIREQNLKFIETAQSSKPEDSPLFKTHRRF